jgi:prepilin signal peptidase PulO-like enzyme (type II secretory pathway)
MVAAMGLPLTLHVVALLATSMLIAISVYDIRHTIIPDVWAYSFAMVALLFGALSFWPITSVYEAVLFFAAGPFIALPLWAFWFFSRGVWMGLGDAKLALGIGWLLGLPAALEALLLSFVIGALVSVFLLIIVPRFTVYVSTVIQGVRLSFNQTRRTIKVVAITRNISAGLQDSHRLVRGKWNMQSEVPFGPFLVAGCFIVWFLYGIGIATPLIFW